MSTPTFDVTADCEVTVDPEWIAEHLGHPDVRVVEVDVSPATYDAGHIHGAVLWNAYSDLREPSYAPIDARRAIELLERSGISRATTIVLYGYGAYLGFWLMKRYRHERVLVMDGPRERWERAGFRWSREPAMPPRADYETLGEDENVIVSRQSVEELIRRPGALILDVRSREEFAGERFWPSGAPEADGRAGHIPASVHVPFELLRDADGMLRSPSELRAVFEAAGVDPEQRVVTYCTIGNRASQVWFALKYVLGYPNASVYYGSWVEWGKLADTPIVA